MAVKGKLIQASVLVLLVAGQCDYTYDVQFGAIFHKSG